MRRPTSIIVLGQRVKIRYVKNLKDIHGDYCAEKKVIRIEHDLKDPLFTLTLIHEAVHALCDRTGLTQVISSEIEEIICENFSTLIAENFEIK